MSNQSRWRWSLALGGGLVGALLLTYGLLSPKAQTVKWEREVPSRAQVGSTEPLAARATSKLRVRFLVVRGKDGVCWVDGDQLMLLSAGKCVVAAEQKGDAEWAGAELDKMIAVTRRRQTVSFVSAEPTNATIGDPYAASATSSSGLPAALAVSRSSKSVCSVGQDGVSFNAAGTCTLEAEQLGNYQYAPAKTAVQSFKVSRDPQTISFSASPTDTVIGGSYRPLPTASSGLPVALSADPATDSVCTLSGGVLHFQGSGTCAVLANQSGDGRYLPAAQALQTMTVVVPLIDQVHYNYLASPDTDLSVGVGIYTDCSGDTPLTHASAAIDVCMPGLYFVGHGVAGLFGPLLNLGVGDQIYYWNGSGRLTVFTITEALTVDWPAGDVWYPGAAAEFQTCINASGTIDRLLITS